MSNVITEIHAEDNKTFTNDDFLLIARIADKLNEQYPGHLWSTHLDSSKTGGVVVIRNLGMSSRYGYVLHIDKLYNDPDLKRVMRAGGEMLERSRLAQRYPDAQSKHIDGIRQQDQPFNGIII